MSAKPLVAVILAAGQGTRMRSATPKVLHEIAGLPMLLHVLGAVEALGARAVVVTAPNAPAIAKAVAGCASIAVQDRQLGTAHAVLAARDAIPDDHAVLVLFADTPLLQPETLSRLLSGLDTAALAVLGFRPPDPTGYGRVMTGPSGDVAAIREHKDASAEERAIALCNSGAMAFRPGLAMSLLDRVSNSNAQGEYYLPDAVALAHANGHRVAVVETETNETLGVNDRVQLAEAEAVMQQRLQRAAMLGGATLVAPETVTLSYDTQLAADVLIEPHVVFRTGVQVAAGARILAFSYLEGCAVGANAVVGPYARLRPGTVIGKHAKIGNFVEIKKAEIGAGAKVNHLSYVGDARIGADANIGAGTITCNYDGFAKHFTEIGDGAFIGSNTALVAPVSVGAGAYVGSGSVITKPVSPGSLAVSRPPQIEKADWADRLRARRRAAE